MVDKEKDNDKYLQNGVEREWAAVTWAQLVVVVVVVVVACACRRRRILGQHTWSSHAANCSADCASSESAASLLLRLRVPCLVMHSEEYGMKV